MLLFGGVFLGSNHGVLATPMKVSIILVKNTASTIKVLDFW